MEETDTETLRKLTEKKGLPKPNANTRVEIVFRRKWNVHVNAYTRRTIN